MRGASSKIGNKKCNVLGRKITEKRLSITGNGESRESNIGHRESLKSGICKIENL